MLFAGQYSSFWIVFHFIKPANIFDKDVKLPLEAWGGDPCIIITKISALSK